MRPSLLLACILAFSTAHSVLGQIPASRACRTVGHLNVVCDHVRWPSPEAVAEGLRSGDDQTRSTALHQMGFTEIYRQSSPTQPEKPVMPDEVRLTYAAIGDSDERQAILAVFISQLQATEVAVAIPVAKGWERIADAGCWCKYEMVNGVDTLSSFLQLQPAPGSSVPPLRFELVLRASGGGSGVYDQTEARFRVHDGHLIPVFSFTSRHRNCNGRTNRAKFDCTATRRWFYPVQIGNEPGDELVEASGGFNGEASAFWSIPDLEITKLHVEHCTTYRWDERRFQYEEAKNAPDPCKRSGQ